MGSAINGVKWTSLSAVVNACAKLGQISILTRFLRKEDFGLIAIAVLVISFTEIFMDMGISSAVLHKQDISKNEYSSLYWFNIISGFVISVIICILAPWVKESSIIVTGNTVIDALYMVVDKIKSDKKLDEELEGVLRTSGYDINRLQDGKRLVLITGHRRENFGDGFMSMCKAIQALTKQYPDVDFVYPMHLNPNVRKPIHEVFGEDLSNLGNMFFIEPLEYLSFVYLMEKSAIVLTDSGGIQEEAPGLGKPVLVMRDTTERPEALEAGTVKLVGTDCDKIVNEVSALLDDRVYYNQMSKAVNPYGDGLACERIIAFI
jgi:UDP-N-acetylglucosamine 2-epimerase (non-hydrolysing)